MSPTESPLDNGPGSSSKSPPVGPLRAIGRVLALALGALGLALAMMLSSTTADRAVEHVHLKLRPGHDATRVGRVLTRLSLRGGLAAGPIEPLFARDAAQLQADRQAAQATSGETLPDLGLWRRVRLSGPAPVIGRAVARLQGLAEVETAFVAPEPEPATLGTPLLPDDGPSCPIRTPSYEPYQGYLAEAPAGINAPAAWSRPGGRGEAIWFADVEGNWNVRHEDLPGERMRHAGGRRVPDRHYEAHGTAVVGVMAARDNGLGVVGIAPAVPRIVTAAIGDISPAAAIDLAQSRLRPGDVLLIELHAPGPRGRFLPMEFWDDLYEVIRLATARGVVVVEAAGNGGEDLDLPLYRGKLDRAGRDSGAIMVGAGAPARTGWVARSRLDFSNYGSRLDVQGWGQLVATLDYGDLQNCDARGRKYTGRFAGTSSATPVVAGAAVLVQSVQRTRRGCVLPPRTLRELLATTGSAQTDGPHGPASQRIGALPDLARALARAETISCGKEN